MVYHMTPADEGRELGMHQCTQTQSDYALRDILSAIFLYTGYSLKTIGLMMGNTNWEL